MPDPSALLSDEEFRTLEAICDALAPALDGEQDALALGRLHVGEAPGLAGKQPAERERVVLAWAHSPIGTLRKGFQTFKRLGLFMYYARADETLPSNPNWEDIRYALLPPAEPAVKRIRPLVPSTDTTLEADAVVVGSGAGGYANLDRGYGVVVEVPPAHPGLVGLGMPWRSGREHKDLMRQVARIATFIAITRDRDAGRVTLDGRGQPLVEYSLSAYDARHLIVGSQAAARMHVAAGARSVGGPYNSLASVTPSRPGAMDIYTREFERRGYVKNDLVLFSAHQMSSCRMGASAARAREPRRRDLRGQGPVRGRRQRAAQCHGREPDAQYHGTGLPQRAARQGGALAAGGTQA